MTINLLSGKWRIPILCKIHDGFNRPGNLSKEMPLISKKVLHSELKYLVKNNLITREQIKSAQVPWVEYKLTPFGNKLIEIVSHIENWGQNNAALFQSSGYTDKEISS